MRAQKTAQGGDEFLKLLDSLEEPGSFWFAVLFRESSGGHGAYFFELKSLQGGMGLASSLRRMLVYLEPRHDLLTGKHFFWLPDRDYINSFSSRFFEDSY